MPRKDNNIELLDDDADLVNDVDGDDVEDSDEYDGEQELTLNLSEKEATSEARVFEPLPGGAYRGFITDGTPERCGPNSKNPGKPYWRLQLTVNGGQYDGRRIYTNVMLFEKALYSWAQLAKALGIDPSRVPKLSTVVGNGVEIGFVISKQKDDYKIRQEGWTAGTGEPTPMKNEVKGFMPAGKVSNNAVGVSAGKVTAARTTADSDLA